MIEYELLLAFSEKVSEEEQKKAIEDLEKLIIKSKGSIVNTESWGKRTLAFPIKKDTNAFYWLLRISGASALPKVVSDAIRIDDKILRFIIEKKIVSKKPKKTIKKKVLVPEIMR